MKLGGFLPYIWNITMANVPDGLGRTVALSKKKPPALYRGEVPPQGAVEGKISGDFVPVGF